MVPPADELPRYLGQCLARHGTDLHQVTMGSGLKVLGLMGATWEAAIPVKGSVCLSCGFITNYVEDLTLRTVRLWAKNADTRAARQAKKEKDAET
ncbi:hypothetical protein ACYOEI_03885 [Singulisphaera rosea]